MSSVHVEFGILLFTLDIKIGIKPKKNLANNTSPTGNWSNHFTQASIMAKHATDATPYNTPN